MTCSTRRQSESVTSSSSTRPSALENASKKSSYAARRTGITLSLSMRLRTWQHTRQQRVRSLNFNPLPKTPVEPGFAMPCKSKPRITVPMVFKAWERLSHFGACKDAPMTFPNAADASSNTFCGSRSSLVERCDSSGSLSFNTSEVPHGRRGGVIKRSPWHGGAPGLTGLSFNSITDSLQSDSVSSGTACARSASGVGAGTTGTVNLDGLSATLCLGKGSGRSSATQSCSGQDGPYSGPSWRTKVCTGVDFLPVRKKRSLGSTPMPIVAEIKHKTITPA
mmetsp:Transcript_3950/g.10970  ORF Transcript_3950/g.10970 Transcript_3950/m.10970 type:complete len:279 (+) Transcript_3950:1028-1864(+)